MTTQKPLPELLSPAGLKNMHCIRLRRRCSIHPGQYVTAFVFVTTSSITKTTNRYRWSSCSRQVYVVLKKKKRYCYCNIQPHNSKLKHSFATLSPLLRDGPRCTYHVRPRSYHDGTWIVPWNAVHLSVQTNAVNWATVKFWSTQDCWACDPISWAITWRDRRNSRTLPRNRARDLCSRCTMHGLLQVVACTFWLHEPTRSNQGALY